MKKQAKAARNNFESSEESSIEPDSCSDESMIGEGDGEEEEELVVEEVDEDESSEEEYKDLRKKVTFSSRVRP